jgi:hypothetical protein
MIKSLSIIEAGYIGNYKVKLVFNDNKTSVVDFEKFLVSNNHPQFNKYRELKNFRKFFIDGGNIVWGKNWDLIFPFDRLYKGEIQL